MNIFFDQLSIAVRRQKMINFNTGIKLNHHQPIRSEASLAQSIFFDKPFLSNKPIFTPMNKIFIQVKWLIQNKTL
jgi:hypothetical protein